MIPKPLNEIEWADLEALRDSGREEDDTIEYKASFSGGSDYLAFSGAALEKAQKGIAREAIAFLNGRGGDIVIGAEEASNEAPTIGQFKPLNSVAATADRLAQSLAALIEPHQSVLGVRAIKIDGADSGVIVVRAPSSLRAPHRFTRDKECYIRRGKESVAMPMDEVQDLTLRRADLREERLRTLASLFDDFDTQTVGRTSLSDHRFHIRSVFVPLHKVEIELDDALCSAMKGSTPILEKAGQREAIDIAFRELVFNWKPVLRGKRIEALSRESWNGADGFIFCAKEIRRSGMLLADFSCRVGISNNDPSAVGFFHEWLSGYLANILSSFHRVWTLRPDLGEGVLRIATRSRGQISAAVGNGMWEHGRYPWPAGVVYLPDFAVRDGDGFVSHFEQAQIDLAALAGFEPSSLYTIAPDP